MRKKAEIMIRDIFTRRNIGLAPHDEQALQNYWSALQDKRSIPQKPRLSTQDIALTFDPRSITNNE